MIYEDLYRQYEQNDVMHRGVCAVELAEKEVDGFLRSLSKELREQADELFGKLARAYEMQGFLFGGTVSGANWAGSPAPPPPAAVPGCPLGSSSFRTVHNYSCSWYTSRIIHAGVPCRAGGFCAARVCPPRLLNQPAAQG